MPTLPTNENQTILSIDEETMDNNLRKFISLGSGVSKIYQGNKKRPVINSLFGTLLLITDDEMSIPSEFKQNYDDYVVVTHRSKREAVYRIQWYRKGAIDAAKRFSQWMISTAGILDAYRRHFTILNPGNQSGYSNVLRVDTVVSDDYEERTSMKFKIGYYQESCYNVGRIENVPFEFNGNTIQAN